MVERLYAFIGLWIPSYKGKDSIIDIQILFTGQDNATIGFFINKMMDDKKKARLINYDQEEFKNFLTTT